MVRRNDRVVVRLDSVALTNTPAIDGLIPLVNKASVTIPRFGSRPKLSEVEKLICKQLGITEEAFIRYSNCGELQPNICAGEEDPVELCCKQLGITRETYLKYGNRRI